ncbi:hypothetical protein K438DRAFT_1763098 [Mycena galopus ATCC 62051]|nr:hypothetical protein K438DRAFT_1763098 [Mycena galopus ATCC 62051]
MSNDSLPAGCSASNFVGASAHTPINATTSFIGCWVGVPSVLQTCCAQSGYTAGFVNGTCGCPLPLQAATAIETFNHCAENNTVVSECGRGTENAARSRVHNAGGKLAVAVLCVSIILGAVGV